MHKDTEFTVEKGSNTINYLDLILTANSEGDRPQPAPPRYNPQLWNQYDAAINKVLLLALNFKILSFRVKSIRVIIRLEELFGEKSSDFQHSGEIFSRKKIQDFGFREFKIR